jgi:pimeloyl-ACP methyl ester carboxylesterase
VLPQGDEYAYGLHIFGAWLGRISGSGRVWDIAVVGLALALAIALGRRVRQGLDTRPSRGLDLLWAGAGIYIATFAFVRSADYRLVFLLLTIPQLVRWGAAARVLPIATLCGVLLTLWLPSEWDNVPVINHLIDTWNDWTRAGGEPLPIAAPAQVLAFAGLACLLVATFPVAERRQHESVTCLSSRRASV